jgi:hypothetical protein
MISIDHIDHCSYLRRTCASGTTWDAALAALTAAPPAILKTLNWITLSAHAAQESHFQW